jgi:hypothetical protein
VTRKFKASYFLFFIMFVSCGRKGEDSVYLIPKNYEGNLMIIFNQDNGVDTFYEKQGRVYQFDTIGVLMTKFSPNYGIRQNHYYYVDSLGNRTNINYALPSQLKGTNDVVIINQEAGNGFDTSKKVERHFELLTVARERNVDSIGNLRSDFIWKVLK